MVMRPQLIRIIRRSLIGIIFLVLLAVGINYVQTRRGRNGAAKKTPGILSSETVRSVEGLEYSDYSGEVLRFKIRAQKLLETQAGESRLKHLEGIEAYAFDSDGSIRNEIRSHSAVYDQDHDVVDFSENVQLFLGRDVELRTDSLHYDLNTNMGTSKDPLKFRSRDAAGSARGVRFDQKKGLLELGSNVDFILVRGETMPGIGGKPGELHAMSERAYCSEIARRILFQGNARIEAGSGTLSGDSIEVRLSPDQKRVTSLDAAGNADYQSEDNGEKRTLSGGRMVFGIDSSGQLERMEVSGKALFSSVSPSSELTLAGNEIDLEFDAASGTLREIRGQSGVQLRMNSGSNQTLISGEQLAATFVPQTKILESLEVHIHASFSVSEANSSAANKLQAEKIRIGFRQWNGRGVVEKLRAEGSAQWHSVPATTDAASPREGAWTLNSSLLEMFYSDGGNFLESGSASGNVAISENSQNSVVRNGIRRLTADSARFHFFPQNNGLRDMEAEGHVRTFYEEGLDSSAKSITRTLHTASDRMKADFELRDGAQVIRTVNQWGSFRYEDSTRKATAERCDYDARTGLLVLTGSPVISDDMSTSTGEQMEYDQKAKMLLLQGNVRSTIRAQRSDRPFFGSSSSSAPILITAGEMKYWTEDGRARYQEKVQLLSESQQLQAQIVELVGGGERVEAHGEILHLISGDRKPGAAARPSRSEPAGKAAGESMTVRSSNLEYLRESDTLNYSGNVRLKSGDVYLSSETLNAVLDEAEKAVKHATASGKVFIRQEGRECKGDKAEWFLNPGKFVVTGNPAEAFDPGKGRSFARRLTSFTTDDRILLEGR